MIYKIITYIKSFCFLVDLLIVKIRRKKNVFIFPYYHTGGAEKVHLDIVNIFPPKDNLIVFTNQSYNSHYLAKFEKLGHLIHLKNYDKNRLFKYLVYKILISVKNSGKVKIIGCNNTYFYDLLDKLPSKTKKIDLVHAFTLPDPGGVELYSLNKVQFIDKRIVINKKTKEDFIKLYSENGIPSSFAERIKIINIAVETYSIKPFKKYNTPKLNIVYCGRIAKEKRPELLVRIANINNDKGIFRFYGHKEIFVNGLENYYVKNIESSDELKRIYENAHILLLTSYREGFPVVIKEAMANGVVCISTNVGSISEHVINNLTGFVVENMDKNSVVSEVSCIIDKLFLDRILLEQISNNSFNHARNNFSMEKFRNNILNELIN